MCGDKISVIRKPMSLIRCHYPKKMSRMDLKILHHLNVEIKEWAFESEYTPSSGGIPKTLYKISIDDFSKAIKSEKSNLLRKIIDESGKEISLECGGSARLIDEYLENAQSVRVFFDSEGFRGTASPISLAGYNENTGEVVIETTKTMVDILLSDPKNSAFVDVALQMSLKGNMSCHILDRISRFKGCDKSYSCSIGSLVKECGIDVSGDIKGANARKNFIKSNIARPIEQIVKSSGKVWEKESKSGFRVTSKKRGYLLMNDIVTFEMNYNESLSDSDDILKDHELTVKSLLGKKSKLSNFMDEE